MEQKAPVVTIELGMMSKGCFIGLEDLVRGNTNYSISVESASNSSSIYVITN